MCAYFAKQNTLFRIGNATSPSKPFVVEHDIFIGRGKVIDFFSE